MKVTASSDWRDAIPFDSPVSVADVVPGEPTRCSRCAADAPPRPRTELWAVKHRHPNHHGEYVRFYCREHVPVIERPVVAPAAVRARRPVAPRPERAAPRRTPDPDKVRAMCPDCFVEVSATGDCGMCGRQVA